MNGHITIYWLNALSGSRREERNPKPIERMPTSDGMALKRTRKINRGSPTMMIDNDYKGGSRLNGGIGDDAGHTPSTQSVLRPLCHSHTNRIAIVSLPYVCNGEGDGHTAGIRQACYWDAKGMRRGCPSPSPTPPPKYTEAQNRHGVMGDTQWWNVGWIMWSGR